MNRTPARRRTQHPSLVHQQQQFQQPSPLAPAPGLVPAPVPNHTSKRQKSSEAKQITGYQQGVSIKLVSSSLVTVYGISTQNIYAKYIAGHYKKAPAFLAKRDTVAFKIPNNNHEVSQSTQSSHCLHIDVTGETSHSITSGIVAFAGKPGGECYYCRIPYTTESLGYPIQPSTVENGCRKFITTDNNICSPECLVAYINYIAFPSPAIRLMYMTWTLEMLRYGFGLTTVIPADDFRLLEKNGGTESSSTWITKRSKYQRMHDVIIIPSKFETKVIA